MRIDFTSRKRATIAAVVLLVSADLALGVYSWRSASAPPPEKVFTQESLQLKLLRADNERAQKIRTDIPKNLKAYDQFERSLFPASSGYSSVTSELDAVARKSGVQLEGKSFKEADVEKRALTEVAVEATVSGDYKNVIEFLNGLQRSGSYQIDSLNLASENLNKGPSGIIKVAVHFRTYFRSNA